MKRIFSLCLLAMMFSIAAFADVRMPDTPKPTPSPKEKKAIDTMFSITITKDAKEARLLIPKDQIKQLRAQLDELDGNPNNAALLTFSRTQTIVGGLFLSLGIVFGGVWLTRVRKSELKPNKTAVASVVLFICGAFAIIAYANVGPPPEARSITGKIFSPAVHRYKQASGKIKLETTDDNYGVELIVPDVPDETK
jgi:hypothetical protein